LFDRRLERQQEGERRIEEPRRAVAFIPRCGVIAFGVDQQSHAAHFLRGCHATFGGAQEKPSAKSATLHTAVDAETPKTIDGDFIATEAARDDGGRAAEFNRGRTQRVKAEDARGRVARRRHETFCAAVFMVLARVAFQVSVETVLAAVERRAVVVFGNRPLFPNERRHYSRTKPALAARPSPALPSGRSRSSPRPLSTCSRGISHLCT